MTRAIPIPSPVFPLLTRIRFVKFRPSALASSKDIPSSVRWLEAVQKETGLRIQHALNGGERGLRIDKKIVFVDGFSEDTRPPTVFEFEGDFWHGNPDLYPFFNLHPLKQQPYGVLYLKTKLKHARIRDAGYDLVVRWECEDRGHPPPRLAIPDDQIRILLSLHGRASRDRKKSLDE